jgi:tRNA pseudouridine32 synthase/23S rRNA pseudouridine746 synthase
MWTSGLLVVAKNRNVYRVLQRQFAERSVKKRYVALLSGPLPVDKPTSGTISLPLYADPLNRPRQVVDYQLGKPAVTDYELLNTPSIGRGQGEALIALYPQTGRTHQLRMHCAHGDGLGCPILGDELYGQQADRLYLHAEQIWLTHPVTGQPMHFEQPAPF